MHRLIYVNTSVFHMEGFCLHNLCGRASKFQSWACSTGVLSMQTNIQSRALITKAKIVKTLSKYAIRLKVQAEARTFG